MDIKEGCGYLGVERTDKGFIYRCACGKESKGSPSKYGASEAWRIHAGLNGKRAPLEAISAFARGRA